jgi:7-cyano-7-deazaguanine synthase
MSVTLLFSGGIDSTVLLTWLKSHRIDFSPIFIDYGQISSKYEFRSAKKIAEKYGKKLETITLRDLRVNSLLADPQRNKSPFFPHRNLLLLVIGATHAYDMKNDGVGIGIHKGTPYPDCTEEFVRRTQKALQKSVDQEIIIVAPFLNFDKREVYLLGKELGAPLHMTYSCLVGAKNHCSKCQACKDRIALFGEA